MKSLRLLLAAVVVVTAVLADHHEPTHDELIDKVVERTGKLTHDIYEFESHIDERIDPERIERAGSLRARVEALEEPSCQEHEDEHDIAEGLSHYHQCGGDDPQCISNLFVCDGINDCRNGEDEKHCTLPTKAGDRFVGDVVYDDCTKRRPDHITVFIETVSKAAFFTPLPKLHVHIEIESESDEDDSHVSLPTDGTYSFAENKLIVYAPEDDGLGLVGLFDGHNFDRFVGNIVHTLSREPCAQFIFHRK